METYSEVLLKTEAEWDGMVDKWQAQQQAKRQAPIIRAKRIKTGIWENLFAYGVGIGLIVQISLWWQWLALR